MKPIVHYSQLRKHGIYYCSGKFKKAYLMCLSTTKQRYKFVEVFSPHPCPITVNFDWIRGAVYELDYAFESYLNLFFEKI